MVVFDPTLARAGLAPENVFVVVNGRSWASQSIANHYCDLRSIPAINVLTLDWSGSVDKIDIATFRREILGPIIKAIEKRGLAAQIDCIAYSADFPYQIDFSKEKSGKFMSGSLTGLTYLYELVMTRQTDAITAMQTNWYASVNPRSPSDGFSNQTSWPPPNAAVGSLSARRYMLSTMLGYTSGRGNALEDIVHYLRRSALCDGSMPEGTVYFMENSDIRATTRKPYFAAVVNAIRQEGGNAEILEGKTPTGKPDVMGAMLGSASYRWSDAKSTFLPGAICENLTSFGGILSEKAGQTPLSEPLRYAASGTSGTVIEPYAIIHKFPHPILHLHYRRGCTLAESFYQSISSPYQLLIVGDPLCNPYGRIPAVSIEGLEMNQKVTGAVRVMANLAEETSRKVNTVDWFVDGIRRSSGPVDEPFEFDTTRMPDGFHELRLVITVDDSIQSKGHSIVPFLVANSERRITVKPDSEKDVKWDGQITLQVDSPGSQQIAVFFRNSRIGQITGDHGIVSLDAAPLSLGPVSLMVAGIGGTHHDNVFAQPIRFEIWPHPMLPSRPAMVGTSLSDGVLLTAAGQSHSIKSTHPGNWLSAAGVKPGESFAVAASLTVPRSAVYQFQAEFAGSLQINVDGNNLVRWTPRSGTERFEVPVYLEKGSHRVRINGAVGPPLRLGLRFGEYGTKALAGPLFQHLN